MTKKRPRAKICPKCGSAAINVVHDSKLYICGRCDLVGPINVFRKHVAPMEPMYPGRQILPTGGNR